MRRYVLTGAPGAGKTTLADALHRRGWLVVSEAATDVITAEQARGVTEPWCAAAFVDTVARLQRERREVPGPPGSVQIHDRSPLCTLALARYLGRPPGPCSTTRSSACSGRAPTSGRCSWSSRWAS